MRRPLKSNWIDRYEVRRQDLILFVEETLEGEPSRDTAVTRRKEDLLDPSFRIGKEIDMDKFMEEFDKIKKDSKKAEQKYKSKKYLLLHFFKPCLLCLGRARLFLCSSQAQRSQHDSSTTRQND